MSREIYFVQNTECALVAYGAIFANSHYNLIQSNGNDGLWLSGHTVNVDNNATDRQLSIQFGTRRKLLVNHLHVFKKKGPIAEDN